MHSELPFMNVLLNVITLTVHPRRWYYAGCVNNMKEQQYLLLDLPLYFQTPVIT